jgi:hypothetical protein
MKAFKQDPIEVVKVVTAKHRDMFSRASDFGYVLIPITLGVAYRLAVEYNPGGSVDESMAYKGLAFLMFGLGLGGALALLDAVNRLEDWEDDQ